MKQTFIIFLIALALSSCQTPEQKAIADKAMEARRHKVGDSLENAYNSALMAPLEKGADSRPFKSSYEGVKFSQSEDKSHAVFECSILIINQTRCKINSATYRGLIRIEYDEESGKKPIIKGGRVILDSIITTATMTEMADTSHLWLPYSTRTIKFISKAIDSGLFKQTPKGVYFEFDSDFHNGECGLVEKSPYDYNLGQSWEDFQKEIGVEKVYVKIDK